MNETDLFLPEVPLRFLGYNKRLGKTSPPQTLYWHSLNTYTCAKVISQLVSVPFNQTESRVLLWSALLHDSGKSADCWQESGHGPHVPEGSLKEKIRDVLRNDKMTKEMAPASDDEIETIIELITEHHTRHTLSSADVERLLAVLKLADSIVSSTRVDSEILDRVKRFLQPKYIPIVLTAEDHPVSYSALAFADKSAEKNRAIVLLTNKLQSMYLLPEGIDPAEFEENVIKGVKESIFNSGGDSAVLSNIYRWTSTGPIRDKDINRFLAKVHDNREGIIKEIFTELQDRKKSLERMKSKGKSPDERIVWFGPFRLLLHATQLVDQKEEKLMGTDILIGSLKKSKSPTPEKDSAKKVADAIGAASPEDYVEQVVDIIAKNTAKPFSTETADIDVLHWSDEILDTSALADKAYKYYKNKLWNNETHRRNSAKYCFSCKRRSPTRDAPNSDYLPTNTWTSSNVEKKKIRVCELCYIAQKYLLPRTEHGRFHLDFTPAYNQARVEWNDVFWQGLQTPDWWPNFVSSHQVVFSLKGNTPNEALAEALGFTLKYQTEASEEYKSFADLLFKNGLSGTVGSGPQYPQQVMLTGCGIRVGFSDWEIYGEAIKMLANTHPQDVFPVNYAWRKLTKEQWGWGTLLASRHRKEETRRKINQYPYLQVVQEIIKMKSDGSDNEMLEKVSELPLWVADKDKRFSSAEKIFRRMERVTLAAARHREKYGENEKEIVDIATYVGMKQLRSAIIKNSEDKKWEISDERLKSVEESLRSVAEKLWVLRNDHGARSDFINAAIMAVAYNARKDVN